VDRGNFSRTSNNRPPGLYQRTMKCVRGLTAAAVIEGTSGGCTPIFATLESCRPSAAQKRLALSRPDDGDVRHNLCALDARKTKYSPRSLRGTKGHIPTIDDPPPSFSGKSAGELVLVLTDPDAADHQIGMC